MNAGRVTAIDLFAGLGGFTTAARSLGVDVQLAANHWPAAVEWHARNHAESTHWLQDLHQADWTQVPDHDLALNAPSCQGHTHARGKDKPRHDSARSTAWAVVSCAEVKRPRLLIVENVQPFTSWALYPAWRLALETLGYALSEVYVDAADVGVPQHRERVFVIGTRSKAPLHITLPRVEHVPVSKVLDLSAGRWSRIERPGRAAATLARIRAGRAAHGDVFLTPYYGSGSGLTGRSIHRPIGTLTTRARWAIVRGDEMRMLSVDEARRCMTFPDDTALPPQAALAHHLLGNAVPVTLAREVIRAVLEAA